MGTESQVVVWFLVLAVEVKLAGAAMAHNGSSHTNPASKAGIKALSKNSGLRNSRGSEQALIQVSGVEGSVIFSFDLQQTNYQ